MAFASSAVQSDGVRLVCDLPAVARSKKGEIFVAFSGDRSGIDRWMSGRFRLSRQADR